MLEKFDKHIGDSYHTCSWKDLYYGNIENLLKTIHNPSVYIEIGMAMGFHIETILKNHNNITCYGIDPYVPYDPTDGFNQIGTIEKTLSIQENFDLFCESVTNRLSKYSNFKHIRQSSAIAYKLFDDNSVDLIFVDGDHTHDAVKNDCELWWNKIKPGGIMCWDDYYWDGVRRAVDEFCSNKSLKLQAVTKNNSYATVFVKK